MKVKYFMKVYTPSTTLKEEFINRSVKCRKCFSTTKMYSDYFRKQIYITCLLNRIESANNSTNER